MAYAVAGPAFVSVAVGTDICVAAACTQRECHGHFCGRSFVVHGVAVAGNSL